MPDMLALRGELDVSEVLLDMCQFGSAHLKPTQLWTSVKSFVQLARRCPRNGSHVHDPLVGKISRSLGLQLCEQWARLWAGPAPWQELTRLIKVPDHKRKRPLGQLIHWAEHRQVATARVCS